MNGSTPSRKLQVLQESLTGCRGKEDLLSRICLHMGLTHKEYRYFSTVVNNHRWRGYVHSERDELFGSIYSLWDNTPFIVRGYPKVKYIEASKVLNQTGIAEEKADGTNIGNFSLPDGTMMGKTRMGFRWDVPGYQGRIWSDLFAQTGQIENAEKLVGDAYMPFFEMYGYLNPCEFVEYSTRIAAKLIDVVDIKNFKFVPYEKKVDLASELGIPLPRLHFQGVFTIDNISWLARESEVRVVRDGEEGLMAKWYDVDVQDQYMGKIKCDNIKALAIKLSGGAIPDTELKKAVRKGLETPVDSSGELLSLVLEELGEDWPWSKIDVSMVRIEREVDKTYPPETGVIMQWLHEKEDEGMIVSVDNKGAVMGEMSRSGLGVNPSIGYRVFTMYLTRKGRSKNL